MEKNFCFFSSSTSSSRGLYRVLDKFLLFFEAIFALVDQKIDDLGLESDWTTKSMSRMSSIGRPLFSSPLVSITQVPVTPPDLPVSTETVQLLIGAAAGLVIAEIELIPVTEVPSVVIVVPEVGS